jgi:nucleoside 2-deoxyribosyltransferase
MKTVYLSGPVTNNPHARDNFEAADKYIRTIGHIPLNPIRIDPPKTNEEDKWAYFMRKSIELLMKSDAIYMLGGWWDSRGAILEFDLCTKLGIPVYFECERGKLNELG